jgi:hypothetical protein
MGDRELYVFEAELEGFEGVSRRLEVLAEQTLIDVHHVLQVAFGWGDDHLYSFWLSDHAYDPDAAEFTAPVDLEPGMTSADVRLAELALEPGRPLSYLFDFGDSWEVTLRVVTIEKATDRKYPRVAARTGEAPPQYPD